MICKNSNVVNGFFYEIDDDQIKFHQTRTIEQIFHWQYEMALLRNCIMTENEKQLEREENGKVYLALDLINKYGL